MRRAKRWLLIFAALLGLMAHAGALRAAFPKAPTTKSSTTTTTTTTTEVPETTVAVVEEIETKPNATTKPSRKLTGIPQIDWVWDPNLPRELNGYNLSSYPFFSTVPPPEEIAFKCDGLHDGFYASIEYKCQVYHHCVYGIRHDFLCANFTAFDQRTFICHFVSDVDCKNSEKFWNRNDNLYMATTTTTTTTTTTPAPSTVEPEYRPRPNRRPLRRRRPTDYYYDDDYDVDYYEEDRRVNRRRKQRPRGRRPADYDEDYEDRRAYSDEDPRPEKRPKNRDRFRDSVEEDYVDDRRIRPRPRPKAGAVGRQGDVLERRKLANGRKAIGDRQSSLDERRSLSDDRGDRPRNRLDDGSDAVERRPIATARRRHNGDRRPVPVDDDLDRPSNRRPEADQVIEDEKPVEPKPEKELVRPSTSASGGSGVSSIFDRPRVPPKIARPVPISEKRKYLYPGQKTTTSTTASPLGDEYYYDDEYDELSPAKDAPAAFDTADAKDPPRRKIQDELNSRRADDLPLRRAHSQTRRGSDEFSRRPGRPFQRKPIEPVRKPVDDYDSAALSNESDEKLPARKRPYAGREKPVDDALPLNDELEEKVPLRKRPYYGREKPVDDALPLSDVLEEKVPLRKRPYAGREKPVDDALPLADELEEKIPLRKRPYASREKPVDDVEPKAEDTRDSRPRLRDSQRRPLKKDDPIGEDSRDYRLPINRRRPQAPEKSQPLPEPVDPVEETEAYDDKLDYNVDETAPEKTPENEKPQREGRPVVRVVKRPFLPSRGGSPYLARGLQPVGAALKQSTTDSTPIDMGSTISGVRLLEHGAPILRDNPDNGDTTNTRKGPRTTLPPQVEYPKATLDELYENDYDVTLNDALNPTLKPLSSSNRNSLGPFNKYERGGYSATSNNNYNNGGDSYYSSTDVRRRTLSAPRNTRQEFRGASRIAQHFYEDFEY